MNKIIGKIKNIESSDNISLVEIETEIGNMCAVVVETPQTATYLKIGEEVYVLFKETEVSVGKNVSGMLSLRNKISCSVERIEKGRILTRLTLKCRGKLIRSIITTKSAEKMGITVGR
ncbi:MAG: TOBE domain-containing protein [Persephonella sp.]|nr:TOBE domain-containing protein [Persephonella sp.]